MTQTVPGFRDGCLLVAMGAVIFAFSGRPAEAQVLRPSISMDSDSGEPGPSPSASDEPVVPNEDGTLSGDGVITDGTPDADPLNPDAVPAGDWTAEAEPDPAGDLSADGRYGAPAGDEANFAKLKKPAEEDLPDPYAPVGFRLGSFNVFAEESTLGVATDNAFASSRNQKADAIIEVRPSFAFRSDWKTHSLSGAIGLVEDAHASYASENTLAIDAALAGRLDLTKRSNIEVEASLNQDQQGRGEIAVPDSVVSPPKVTTGRAGLRYNQRFNRLAISLGTTYVATDHADQELSDGSMLSRADENTEEAALKFRAGYEWLDGYEVFGEVGASRLGYEVQAQSDGIRRDGNGLLVRAGVKVLTGKPIEGEASLGWREFDPGDGRLAGIAGVVVDGALRVRPDDLTVLSVSAQSDIDGTSIAGAAGVLNRSGRLELRREVTRAFVVIAGLGYTVKDYQGVGSKEAIAEAALDLEYNFSRHWALIGGFDTTTTTTESAGSADSAVTENRLRAGLRWQL